MALIPASLGPTIARQHGTVTTTQLLAAGLTNHELRRLVSSGHLIRVLSGAYRSSQHPDSELSRCVALSLTRPQGTICGPTAARLLGLRRLPRDGRIHLLMPPGSASPALTGCVAYRPDDAHARTSRVRPDEIRLLDTPDLAVDLARFLHPDALASVVEQMIKDHGCSAQRIGDAAERLHRRRRPWLRTLDDVLARRLSGGAAESDGEVQLGAALRVRGVTDLVRQFRIELPGYGLARFDLAVPGARWAIEVDLHPSHFERDRAVADALRDRAALAAGWVVRRVVAADMASLPMLAGRLHYELEVRRTQMDEVVAV